MYRGSSLAAQRLGDGGPPLSVSAPCPTALSFGGSGEIISRAMTLITTERPVALQPRVSGTLQRNSQERDEGERRRARQEEFSSAEPTGGDERSVYTQQPSGGPVSSAQSVTLEPAGSCEDALTLLSPSLQPLCTSNELMSCLCMSFIRLCVAVWICFQRTRSDRAWG